jgi:hypothetical protein
MADKGRSAALPQRVPGAARTGPPSPVSATALALPEEIRQRIQAAVKSELADPDASERAAKSGTTAVLEREPMTGPVLEGQVTHWHGSAVEPRAAVRAQPLVVQAQTPAGPGPEGPPEPKKPWRRPAVRLIALVLALIVIGSLVAVAAARRSPSSAAVRAQAAAWVAGQINTGVTVSCDAAMCAALQANGFPASKLVVLGPTSPDPVPSAVVVETPTVRDLFGSNLAAAWAPAVLASFGSGSGAITVRAVAPQGAAAYQSAVSTDLASRIAASTALLHNAQVAVSAMARNQLLAGQVDLRLLLALASVATHEPINIVRFGSLGPGASPSVPLDFADLAESVPAAHLDTAGYVRAVWAVLNGTDAAIRPERAISGPIQGQAILQVEFASPSPLGNPSPASP